MSRYYPNINDSQIEAVLSFSLIWNLFESRICEYFVTVGKIENKVDAAFGRNNTLPTHKYEKYFIYFKNRYGSIKREQALNELAPIDSRVSRNVREANARIRGELERIFNAESPSPRDMVYASLLIAYRIRNNLFHGIKGIPNLPEQTELFRVVNSVLADFIEAINPPIAFKIMFL